MKLEILSPEGSIFAGEVTKVSLPGKQGAFTVLNHHAPLISSLTAGKLVYASAEKEESLFVNSGFVEVNDNVVTVCIERVIPK